MNCSFCGKELKVGAKFCTFCGTRAPTEQPKNVVGEYTPPIRKDPVDVAQETLEKAEMPKKEAAPKEATDNKFEKKFEAVNEEQVDISTSVAKETPAAQEAVPTVEKKPRRGKKKLVIALVAAVVALAVIIAALAVSFTVFFAPKAPNLPISAYSYSSGACICYGDGKMINLRGNITDAYLTPDTERIICVNNGVTVCYLETGKSDIREIFTVGADKKVNVVSVCNDMVLFATDECLYSYAFEDGVFNTVIDNKDVLSSAVLSTSAYVSADGASVAYIRDNNLFVMTPDDHRSERMVCPVSANAQTRVHDVSCDGEAILWSEFSSGMFTLYLSCEESMYGKGQIIMQQTVTDESALSRYTLNCPMESSDMLVITSSSDNNVYVKRDDASVSLITLSGAVGVSSVLNGEGKRMVMCDEVDAEDNFIICATDKDGDNALYGANASGLTTCLIPKLSSFDMGDGVIAYVTADERAYVARFDAKKLILKSNVILSDNVDNVYVADKGGKYVYATSSTDESTAELMRFDIKAGSLERITSGVHPLIHLSEDGNTVYYYLAVESDSTSGLSKGLLSSYGKKGTSVISRDVIVGSLTSNRLSGEIDPKSAWFEMFTGNIGDSYTYNAMFYNGKTPTSIVRSIMK